jgi:hypothetical protein
MNKWIEITDGESLDRDEITFNISQEKALRLARNLIGQMDLKYPNMTVRVSFSAKVDTHDEYGERPVLSPDTESPKQSVHGRHSDDPGFGYA